MTKWRWLLILAWSFLGVVPARAVGGLYLSPPFAEYTIQATDKEKQLRIEIGNNTSSEVTFDMSVVDFGSLDETGGVAFLTTKADKGQHKYALASWISLEKSEVTVPPNAKESVLITILNKESLSPGGHYGAVIATVMSEEKVRGDTVGINQSLASLLYVQKNGGEIEELKLKNISWKENGLQLPKNVEIRFENSGNVHLVPRGKIDVKDMWGNLVGRGIINEGSSKVIPESFRRMTSEIASVKWWKWPGRYVMDVEYRFEGKEIGSHFKVNFVYIGWEGVLVAAAAATLLLIALKLKRR